MKILVTGGAGFIGTHLVKKLKTLGHEIIVIDDYSSGKKSNKIEGVKYYQVNTSNLDIIEHKLTNIDIVFHFAEYSRIATSYDEIERVWLSNNTGSFKVVNFCKKNNIKIVYAGSSTKFVDEGFRHSPYSFTKYTTSELVKGYGEWYNLPYAICYFYNVFGEGYDTAPVEGYECVVSIFEKQYKNDQPLTVCGDGSHKRAFTYIDDVIDGLIKAWEYPENIEVQLNNPNSYSILELAQMFDHKIKHIPDRPGDRKECVTTNNYAREKLNWDSTMNVDEWIEKIKIEKKNERNNI